MPSLRKRFTIPYNMFDPSNYGLSAKNAKILERIYHKGHAHAWDGQEVLSSLIETHGDPSLPAETKKALGRVFSIIMWGELAAWRISAELADEIEPLHAKMAATSQAFDEARHFYVMHDYLVALDALPDALPWGPRKLLEDVMNADHLSKKLMGMQLMVEPVALTLFHVIKQMELEPVLTHLLPYYERDEARHVALGIQYLPAMLSRMSVAERLSLWGFQMKLLTYEIWANIDLARDLKALGVDPRKLIEIGKGKQMKALDMVNESLGIEPTLPNIIMGRYADTLTELTLPQEEGVTLTDRLRNTLNVAIHGTITPDMELTPTITDDQTPLVRSAKARDKKTHLRATA